jgi:crossover junction endodeoxyribonuclease RusA
MSNPAPLGNSGKDIAGTSAQFFVAGRPVPQGSLKFINGHAIHMRAQDLALWRADIARVAKSVIWERAVESVEVHLTFTLLKPKTVKRTEPFVRPDIDKLIRAVLDGLTGVAYDDDQQVTKITAIKKYGTVEGVLIRITDKAKLSRNLLNAESVIDDYFNTYSD